MFHQLRVTQGWDKGSAWKGIALLLLSCKIWARGWEDFHDVVVYRESNDFKVGTSGPNATIRKAQVLTDFLANQLGVAKATVCESIGQYWENPLVADKQPHNLVGHAFRSIVTEVLKTYGSSKITFEEEVDPYQEFPGYQFSTRSKEPRIDIVARNDKNQTVALISTRWRFRHDRVDVIDEALAYVVPARRSFPGCRFYAMLGEFNPARLDKVLDHSPPKNPTGPISAAVHFLPSLITQGLGEDGRLHHLQSLAWLVDQTFKW
jgi:hypothetical protein